MKFRFKIDEKSLFYGLYNDYVRGQTATVSTPINQSKDPDKWHKDIMKLLNTIEDKTNMKPYGFAKHLKERKKL